MNSNTAIQELEFIMYLNLTDNNFSKLILLKKHF